MTNVVDFSEFESVDDIGAHQAGLVRVVLEGRMDVDLFRRFWFSHLQETFEFVEASTVGDGAGCTAVGNAVKALSAKGVPAVGIIDRDCLFKQARWPALYMTDDSLFDAETRDGNVYVTRLWEVEAYLLDPDLLGDWVSTSHVKPPGPESDCRAAVSRTLVECDVLLTAAPYFAAKHVVGEVCAEKHFEGLTASEVADICAAKLAKGQPVQQTVAAGVEALIANIRASLPDHEADRLLYLLRFVDTKRLLARLATALQVRPDTHWSIAGLMFRTARRPPELERILIDAAALAA